ncbi:hypothetical protein AB6A40_002874 [Gnathostoma spinigerum]|uniref:Uncharacterized protein n=1 Tax=Gnathostoma spinigerum TaxID=75299 RepID=A0ABD6E916_9BILA
MDIVAFLTFVFCSFLVLFESRCKLYRFDNDVKEWKERGIGNLKILQNPETKHYRIVMRRDQVHKVCANHNIQFAMHLTAMNKSDRAFVWLAQDYSEGKMAEEKLAARFKTPELAEKFADVFEKGRQLAAQSSPQKMVDTSKSETSANIESTFPNTPKVEENLKPKEKNESSEGFGDKFKPAVGSWECKSCYVRNKSETTVCECCGTGKDGSLSNDGTKNSSLLQSSKPESKSGFSFGFGVSSSVPVTTQAANAEASKFGIQTNQSTPTTNASTLPAFTFKPSENKTDDNAVKSVFGFGLRNASLPTLSSAATTPSTKPSFVFAASSTVSTTPNISSGFSFKPTISVPGTAKATTTSLSGPGPTSNVVNGSLPAPSFTFGSKPTIGGAISSPKSSVNTPNTKPSLFGSSALGSVTSNKDTPASLFGGGLKGSGGFAALAAASGSAASKDSTVISNEAKITPFAGGKFNNTGNSIFSALSGSKSSSLADTSKDLAKKQPEAGSGDDEEYEPDAQFEPVIPLPSLVKVETGEEDEEILFKAHGKLYRFANEISEYKERGVGDIKILHNPSNGRYRVVMRRDQVHKVCVNAPILPGMSIKKKPNTKNTAMWISKDYSEGPEGTHECFVIRFKDAKPAEEFISVFSQAVEGKFSKPVVSGEKNVEETGPSCKGLNSSLSPKMLETRDTDERHEEHAGAVDGDGKSKEDYEEDAYAICSYLSKAECDVNISDAYVSPLKMGAPLKFSGCFELGETRDKLMLVRIVNKEDVVELEHFVEPDLKIDDKENEKNVLKYITTDESSKHKQVMITFKDNETRRKVAALLDEGIKNAKLTADES